jgi:hypothetical protein
MEDDIEAAIEGIRRFIAETTGTEATTAEIADALKRYFVLNEIKAHIEMKRTASVHAQHRLTPPV